MVIYLDESGDLGFGGGGSDHFVVAFIATEDPTDIQRAVRATKRKFGLPRNYEIKGSGSSGRIRNHLLKKLSALDVEVHSIVMRKSNVLPRLRKDTNILYNYVLGLILVPYVVKQKRVKIIVDRRVVSVKSGLKLDEYLKCRIWYEKLADVEMDISHKDSKFVPGIQAVDVISYSIFRKHERRDIKYYKLIRRQIRREKKLFFHGQ